MKVDAIVELGCLVQLLLLANLLDVGHGHEDVAKGGNRVDDALNGGISVYEPNRQQPA